MYFFEVGIRSSRYHGIKPLIYSYAESIQSGTVVNIPLMNGESLGVVYRAVEKPKNIRLKEIIEVYTEYRLPEQSLSLLEWLGAYYPSASSAALQLLLPSKMYPPSTLSITNQVPQIKLPQLTKEQDKAIGEIKNSSKNIALLHGDTGTGKTRVYLELAVQAIKNGKSAIILTPEIGLTPQLLETFSALGTCAITVLHSGLTKTEKDKRWLRCMQRTEPQIIIGPRSALFVPIQNIGLIVVDEAHDSGYKQDQPPHYEASRVAAKIATLNNALCVFGTATPNVSEYWHLSRNKVTIVRMTSPIAKYIKRPQVHVIDSRDRNLFLKSPLFSDAMLKELGDNLTQNKQSLVFLNKRGTARLITCASCGWQALCKNCDLPLAYHSDLHKLVCHTCGYSSPTITTCPTCSSAEIIYRKHGTKSLHAELAKHLPTARIQRFDSDNLAHEKLDKNYSSIIDGSVDIIIGTQILAKGLDIPRLALVAVPLADTSSYLPDFTSDEQTYQLLRQVMGRVGRTKHPSSIILQTQHPDSPLLKSIIDNNWQLFYQNQLIERKKYNFPPFCYILQLTCIRKKRESAKLAGAKLAIVIKEEWPETTVLGPAPRFREKQSGNYQWQVIVKSSTRATLVEIIRNLPANWRYNIDPANLL